MRRSLPKASTRRKIRSTRNLEAKQEGFKNYEEKALSIPAFEAHPDWHEFEGEVMILNDVVLRKVADKTWKEFDTHVLDVGGRIFVRRHKRGPRSTITTVVRWFKKHRPEQARQILAETKKLPEGV